MSSWNCGSLCNDSSQRARSAALMASCTCTMAVPVCVNLFNADASGRRSSNHCSFPEPPAGAALLRAGLLGSGCCTSVGWSPCSSFWPAVRGSRSTGVVAALLASVAAALLKFDGVFRLLLGAGVYGVVADPGTTAVQLVAGGTVDCQSLAASADLYNWRHCTPVRAAACCASSAPPLRPASQQAASPTPSPDVRGPPRACC